MYNLIDIDQEPRRIIATEATEAAVLAHTPYSPTDCLETAESWQDVVDAAEGYDGGLTDLVEGYVVEEVKATTEDMIDGVRSIAQGREASDAWADRMKAKGIYR